MRNSTSCIQHDSPKHENTFTAEELWERVTKPYTLYRTVCLAVKLKAPHAPNFPDLQAKTLGKRRLKCLKVVS